MHAAESAMRSESCGEAIMFLEDTRDAFRDTLHIRDDDHTFGFVEIIFGGLLRVGVFLFSLLVFLDLYQCPGRVTASVQHFVDGLVFLLLISPL